MLAFSALIAGSFSLGGMMANLVSPTAFSALRFLLAAAVVGAAAVATRSFRRQDAGALWRYLLLGLCLAAYFVLMFEGLKTAPPVATAAVFTLTPIMAAAFGWLLLRQMTTPRIAAALMIGGAGAVWVIFRLGSTILVIHRQRLSFWRDSLTNATTKILDRTSGLPPSYKKV